VILHKKANKVVRHESGIYGANFSDWMFFLRRFLVILRCHPVASDLNMFRVFFCSCQL